MHTPKTTYIPASHLSVTSSPKDSFAIHELIHRLFLAEDSRDATALADSVTQDYEQKHILFGHLKGREAFVQWVLDNPRFFDGLRHQAINTVTSARSSEEATVVSYIQVLQVFSDDPAVAATLPRMIGHGVVTDTVVRDSGTWRIAKRTYDQFSILPAFAPDEGLRAKAGERLELNQPEPR